MSWQWATLGRGVLEYGESGDVFISQDSPVSVRHPVSNGSRAASPLLVERNNNSIHDTNLKNTPRVGSRRHVLLRRPVAARRIQWTAYVQVSSFYLRSDRI